MEFIFQTITHGQIAGDQTFSKKCHGLLEEVVGELQEIKNKSFQWVGLKFSSVL